MSETDPDLPRERHGRDPCRRGRPWQGKVTVENALVVVAAAVVVVARRPVVPTKALPNPLEPYQEAAASLRVGFVVVAEVVAVAVAAWNCWMPH